MEHSGEFSTSILESLREGIVAFGADRRAVMANGSVISLMGWEGRPVVGESVDALCGARLDLLRILDDAFVGKAPTTPTDLIYHHHGGGIQHLRVTTSSLMADQREGLVMVVRDVSELKRMEWEMFQVEKMSALGRLAASVAHEVRNPLGAIDIQLQLLEQDLSSAAGELTGPVYRHLSIAQTEMKRLDRIVRNFLRFSRTPDLHLQHLSLNDVVRRVFDLVSPEARERGVELVLDLSREPATVDGDDNQLGQAILNMAVNAFQSIEGTGQVGVKTRVDRTAKQVCLAISDTGRGIPDEEIDRIFEFYYTTKDEGTGLGLSIAQRIIFQHGGHIDVESQEGAGTTFQIHLPTASDLAD